MSGNSKSATRKNQLSVVLLCFGLRGGMVHYCGQLAHAMNDIPGVGITVIAPATTNVQSTFDSTVELRTFPVGGGGPLGTITRALRGIWTVYSHLNSVDPDIIHDTTYGGFPSLTVLPLLVLCRVPLLATIHDPVPHSGHEIEIFGIDLKLVIIRLCSRFFSCLIVHGEHSKRTAVTAGYPQDRLTVLPHGLYDNFTEYTPTIDAEAETYDLLFFGNIRPNKGYDRVPAIVDAVSDECGSVSALVAGTTDVHDAIPDEEMERILEGLKTHPHITLRAEYIPDEEVVDLFSQCSILVLPYYDATQSGVALIGYALEKPMVATDTGDMGKMIRRDKTGLLADPEDTEEIATQIAALLQDTDRQHRLTERIREKKSDHSWDNIAKETAAHYRELLR